MIKKFVHSLSYHHHTWRDLKFDELAELYTSMTIRSFGFGIIGIFVPVYLYKLGVSLQEIFFFFALFHILRIPISFAVAYIVGRIGPKHTIAVSTVLIVVFLSLLLSYEKLGWPLYFLAFMFSLANGLFFIAYNTDFSKIKDKKHGGKELGWLYIFEKAGGALGPIVGGLIASYIAPELTIIIAIIVLLASLIPLFATNEPVKTHQKIKFKGFSNSNHIRDFTSLSGFHLQQVVANITWPLLLAVFIFTDDTYAKLGFVIGSSLVVSMFSARMFGKFIDNKKGHSLLNYGVLMNLVLSIARTFTNTASGAVATSTLGEPVMLSYRMPLVKGFYDESDNEPGYRIVYIVWAEVWTAVTKGLYFVGLMAFSFYYDPVTVLRVSFLVVGILGLLMLTQRFEALKRV